MLWFYWHDYLLLVEFEVEITLLNDVVEIFSKSHKSIHISCPTNFRPHENISKEIFARGEETTGLHRQVFLFVCFLQREECGDSVHILSNQMPLGS